MMLRCMPFSMLPHRRHKQHLLHAQPCAPGSSLPPRQAAMQEQVQQQLSGRQKLLLVVHHLLPQQQQEGQRPSLWMLVSKSTNGLQRARKPAAPQDTSSSSSSQPSHSSAAIHQSLSQQQRIARSSWHQHSRPCKSAGLGPLAVQPRRQLPMQPRQLLLVPPRARPKRQQPPQTPGTGLLLSAASLLQQTQLPRPQQRLPPRPTAAATLGWLHQAWEAQQQARAPTASQASCRRCLSSRGWLGLVARLAAAEEGPMRALLAGLWQRWLLPLTASSSTGRHLPCSATAWACRQADRW